MPEEQNPQSSSRPPRRLTDRERTDHARGLISSLFSGFRPPATEIDDPPSDTSSTPTPASTTATAKNSAESTLPFNIDQYIPQDGKEIQKTPIYKSAYRLIQWQRDNYLVGTEYANWRQEQRQKERPLTTSQEIPLDPTALGLPQLVRVASNYIPTTTPLVVPLVSPLFSGPALYPTIVNSVVSVIQGQQRNLDNLVVWQLVQFLKNPQYRIAMKNSTQGFLATTYRSQNDE